jgi:hypothetical protein
MNGQDVLATSDKLYALSLVAHFQARYPELSDVEVSKIRAMILANDVYSKNAPSQSNMGPFKGNLPADGMVAAV